MNREESVSLALNVSISERKEEETRARRRVECNTAACAHVRTVQWQQLSYLRHDCLCSSLRFSQGIN